MAALPTDAMAVVRLTVWPLSFFKVKEASRVSFTRWAICIQSPVPGDRLPFVRNGAPVHGLGQPVFVFRQLLQGGPLGAERAAIDHVIGVAFDVDDPAVAPFAGVDDGAAAHRTIAADGGGFLGILGLQHLAWALTGFRSKPNPPTARPAAVAPVIWINACG
jgi:hypothetical protein